MNDPTAGSPSKEDGIEWARRFFLEVCCQPAHIVITTALTEAGFDVRRIEKHWFHNCWEVLMRRSTAGLAPQHRLAARQVRLILADAGVYVEPDAISIDRRGERIQVAFIYDGGQEGVWH